MGWLSPLIVAFGTSLVLVPALRAVARGRSVVAQPRADRWHRAPTALLGGVAIWGAVLAGVATGPWAAGAALPGDPVWGILLGGSILGALGALDDLVGVKPATKVVAQLVAAAVAIWFGYQVHFFAHPILNLAASFLWIVVITNAVNLLDNMDGLAAGVVLIAAAYIGVSYVGEAVTGGTVLALALVGSLAAFLVFNANPASIFMGDSGSMFIGFSLAALSLGRAHPSTVLSFVAVPAATLLVPILDTTLVAVTRLLRGQSIAVGGRDHTSHRLVMLGLSEREAVAVLWLLAAIAGGSAIVTQRYSYSLGLGLLPVLVIGFGLLGVYLSRLSFVEDAAAPPGHRGFVRLAIELTYKRRVLEVLLDFILVVGCYYMAFGLRGDFRFSSASLALFQTTLPLVVAATMLAFFVQGVYRGVWTYVGVEDLLKYVRACALAVVLGVVVTLAAGGRASCPGSVLAIFGMLMCLGVGGSRLSFRLMDEALCRRRSGRPVLIIGAGSGGDLAVRELLRNPRLGRRVVGFADDAPLKHGRVIRGYPVLGGTGELARLHVAHGFEEIIVSPRTLAPETLARVRGFGELRNVPVRFFRVDLLEPAPATAAKGIVPPDQSAIQEVAAALANPDRMVPLAGRRRAAIG